MFPDLVTAVQTVLWYISKHFCWLWSQSDVVWSGRQRRLRQVTCLLCFWCSPIPHASTSKTQFLLVSSSLKGLSWGYWTLLCSHWQRRGNAKPMSDRCGRMKTQLPWLLLQWQLGIMSSTCQLCRIRLEAWTLLGFLPFLVLLLLLSYQFLSEALP